MKIAIGLLSLALVFMAMASYSWHQEARQWKHAYEAELEIRSNLDELLKEFRSVCAER